MGKGGESSVKVSTERKITIEELAKHRTPDDGRLLDLAYVGAKLSPIIRYYSLVGLQRAGL